jgi:hypothetical protein
LNPRTANALKILLGSALALVWIAAAIMIGSVSLMGTLMANDAGTVADTAHTRLILLVLAGQILAGLAGLPLGLSIFWTSQRKRLLRLFAILLVGGCALVVLGVYTFASQLPSAPLHSL